MESSVYSCCDNKTLFLEAVKLAEKLLRTAEKGIVTCEDDSCLVLTGVIRDCGYKIRRTVEQERSSDLHKNNGQHLMQ
jgi:hypothetical protein